MFLIDAVIGHACVICFKYNEWVWNPHPGIKFAIIKAAKRSGDIVLRVSRSWHQWNSYCYLIPFSCPQTPVNWRKSRLENKCWKIKTNEILQQISWWVDRSLHDVSSSNVRKYLCQLFSSLELHIECWVRHSAGLREPFGHVSIR